MVILASKKSHGAISGEYDGLVDDICLFVGVYPILNDNVLDNVLEELRKKKKKKCDVSLNCTAS